MYIEPNTNIRILKDVPLDTTYDHTIYFSSATSQTNYFAGLTKYNLNNQTYQRVKRGYARVQRKAEDLYDCNYMMFQNSAYGNCFQHLHNSWQIYRDFRGKVYLPCTGIESGIDDYRDSVFFAAASTVFQRSTFMR